MPSQRQTAGPACALWSLLWGKARVPPTAGTPALLSQQGAPSRPLPAADSLSAGSHSHFPFSLFNYRPVHPQEFNLYCNN